jgi:MarR family protein
LLGRCWTRSARRSVSACGALEPAVRESELLAASLDALDGVRAAEPATPAPKKATARRSRRSSRPGRPRTTPAPRDANRAAVLAVLGERPGVSAGELAAAGGVARPVLYALLKRLEEFGEVAKERLPGGATGHPLAAGPAALASAPSGGTAAG